MVHEKAVYLQRKVMTTNEFTLNLLTILKQMRMKKFFTLIAMALVAVGVNAQIQTIASYTVTTSSTLAGEDNTPDAGTGCSVQLHGTAVEQKDGENYGLKLDSESKYIQIDLNGELQEGDVVNISYFMGSNSSEDNTNGVVLTNAKPSTEGYAVLATMYAQIADKKDVVTSKYTAVGGEKKFFVYKISTGASVYFHKVEITRGKDPQTTATINFAGLSTSDFTYDETVLTTTTWTDKDDATNTAPAFTFNGTTEIKNTYYPLELTGKNAKFNYKSGSKKESFYILCNNFMTVGGKGAKLVLSGAQAGQFIALDVAAKANISESDQNSGKVPTFSPTNATLSGDAPTLTVKDEFKRIIFTVTATGDVTIEETQKGYNIKNAYIVNSVDDLPEIVTAIQSVKAANVKESAAIYNLAGQKVSDNFKGIAIQNGKKMILK